MIRMLTTCSAKRRLSGRDILMDYARPDSLRFALQVVSILIIAVYLGWTVQILWR